MIAEIKKYTFLVHHRDYETLLSSLYEAGVVHITEKRKFDETSTVNNYIELLGKYKAAISHLSRLVPEVKHSELMEDPAEIISEYETSVKEIEENKNIIDRLRSEAVRVQPWGYFDTDTFNKLRGTGWTISLYSCPQKSFKGEWNQNYTIEIISRKTGRLFFAVIHREDGIPQIDADPETKPERPASSIYEEIWLYEKRNAEIESKLRSMAPVWINSLRNGTISVINKIEYETAAEQADKYADNNLYVLEGWVPASGEGKIKEIIGNSACYSFVSEPLKDEKVPVILVNNRFSSLFEPIARLFSLPDYRELDLTPFFAPFFMLFFGFCLGDAGYGLFFLIAGFIIKRKVSKEFKPIISLAQYFGVAAVMFGLISGTFFGINLIDSGYTITRDSAAEMRSLGVPERIIYSFGELENQKFRTRESFSREAVRIIGVDDFSDYRKSILKSAESDLPLVGPVRSYMLESMNMFYLALMIGALQILFGMILKVVNIARVRGFRYSLSTMGWVIFALTMIIFKGGGAINILDEGKLKALFTLLLIAAGILIFLFNNPDLNIFGRIGNGIWESYTILTGVFGDLLSYIRLFALGISSSILGFVFNQISLQFLSIPYVGWLFFLIMLLFGHSLNIAIATLGSFVHPMRLTFVEFYKNAGFKGGGIEYKPFRIKK